MRSSHRPFRFGVQINSADSADEWKEKARRAEALGYDVLTIADHFGGCFAHGPALSMAAAVTSNIRLGTLVLQNPLRHPALLAMEAATLDLLSDGRFELGLGAGGSLMSDFERTGISFDPPGFRLGALEESVQVVKALLRGESLTFDGQYYQFTEFESFPMPVQQHLPLMIGAGGPRMLRLAAREADIVSVLPLMRPHGGDFHLDESTADAFRSKVDLLRDAAGPSFDQLEIHMLLQRFALTDRPHDVAQEVSDAWRISPDEVLSSPYMLIGSVAAIVEQIVQRREDLGISYYVVFEPHLETFAPILGRLKGR